MTSAERMALREALDRQGFRRTGYTQDHGDGVYTETWTKLANVVTISWGRRT